MTPVILAALIFGVIVGIPLGMMFQSRTDEIDREERDRRLERMMRDRRW